MLHKLLQAFLVSEVNSYQNTLLPPNYKEIDSKDINPNGRNKLLFGFENAKKEFMLYDKLSKTLQ